MRAIRLTLEALEDRTCPSGTWGSLSPMPTPRFGHGAAAVNGIVYAIGGQDAGFLNTVEAYDPAANAWTTKAPMPTARSEVGVAAVNGIVYAVGGGIGSGSYTAAVEAYDPTTDSWTAKAPMFVAANVDQGVTAAGGILYVLPSGTNDLEAYDPATDSWSHKAGLPGPIRGSFAMAAVSGLVYVIGGSDGVDILTTVQAYNPATDAWSTAAPMPTARASFDAAELGGKIYAVGGNGGADVVEVCDPLADTWTTETPMPTPRAYHAVAAAGGKLYALGGFNGAALGTNEALAPEAPVHPFANLSARAKVRQRGLDLGGTFTLGSGNNGINPLTENITLQLGTYTVTIPAGSFQERNGKFEFVGEIGGVAFDFVIHSQGGNKFAFDVSADGVDLTSLGPSLTLSLTIGDDTGTTIVRAH